MYHVHMNPELLPMIERHPNPETRQALCNAWHLLEIIDQWGESDVESEAELAELLDDCNTLREAIWRMAS